MKIIDNMVKFLIRYKYKRQPFMAWSWSIDEIHEINILTAEYHQDHCRFGTREDWYSKESEGKV